jgi:hypothetical protein
MEKEVQLLIEKYAKKVARGKPFDWEKLGTEIEKMIRDEQDKVMDYSNYSESCKKQKNIRETIEEIYFHYFSYGTGYYNWIGGNDNWKELIKKFKK